MNRLLLISFIAGALAVSAYAGYRYGQRPAAATSATAGAERTPLYWYDPMSPAQHFDKPGKSPFMDMQLVPKYADEEDAGVVSIDPRMVQNLGVRTVKVERGPLGSALETVGSVEVDERRVFSVEARAAGWIEQLPVRAVGDPVQRGQKLAGVYSPDLYGAQQELVLAVASGDAGLTAASRQRAVLMGVSDAQIEEVLRSKQAQRQAWLLAPSNGVVTELNVRQNSQVAPGTPLMRIADLSEVWIVAEIPEAQASAVHEGTPAEARVAAIPGQVFKGRVQYVYPRVETSTRTLRARLAFENPRLALKPGMYAQVNLAGGTGTGSAGNATLTVPTEAVIRTGTRAVVIVAEGEGRFRPLAVELGPERGDRITIVSGLEDGQRVVTSGQFLIDSEASLRGAFNRLDEPAPGAGK